MYTGIELVVRIVLAHFVADYLLQPKEMAVRKSEKSLTGGVLAHVHCLVYLAVMILFTNPQSKLLLCGCIYLSHYVIDRYGLAENWLRLIKGRDIKEEVLVGSDYEVTFACIVYVVADATLHFLLLGAIFKWIK